MEDFEMSLYVSRNRCILTPLADNDTIFGIMPEQVLKLLHWLKMQICCLAFSLCTYKGEMAPPEPRPKRLIY